MDFVRMANKYKNGLKYIYPEFIVDDRGKDLMARGGAFYAIWDEEKGLWSTNEYDVARLVDAEIRNAIQADSSPDSCRGLYLSEFSSETWTKWKRYLKSLPDKWTELDTKIFFENSDVSKSDFCSRKLPYPLQKGRCPAYNELMSTLYSPQERQKIEWAIGSIISGDSKQIQKFLVFYGAAGSGKSTVLNIVQQLFDGYYSVFEAKALGSTNNQFSLEPFKKNPLVAIQHDGDLSRIEDNTKLNSIISHERMIVNEKFKGLYELAFHSFLMMGTNTPVRITDAKSGILRRLIDVTPSGERLPFSRYSELVEQVKFELGAIAYHCLEVYENLGMSYYDTYVPVNMISATNDFFDFVEFHYDDFMEQDSITLATAWRQYKEYVDFANLSYSVPHRKFKEELKNYFREFYDRFETEDGKELRSLYSGFRSEKFETVIPEIKLPARSSWLELERQASVFDIAAQDYPAQYATEDGSRPRCAWDKSKTTLSEITTTELHWVKVPSNHIIIDFDLRNKSGEKDLKLNLKAASKFPQTYAELSKSGGGLHLHYIYDGDVSKLSSLYSEGIEIKVYTGNQALRRKLTECNNCQIATINSGLPLKEVKSVVVDKDVITNEKAIRTIILRNLRKEYHKDTSSSVNYIADTLEKAYASGATYDVRNMYQDVFTFASQSSNQADRCMKLVSKLHFCSKDVEERDKAVEEPKDILTKENEDQWFGIDNPCFYDCEVFPNFFGIGYGFDKDLEKDISKISIMKNPTSDECIEFSEYPLIGFNNVKYDNHMVYGRILGYDNAQMYDLSNKIINERSFTGFFEAKGMSLSDIYDFAKEKKGLKKWEIEMAKKGIPVKHHELGLEWDKPVPEDMWDTVMDYCADDVRATYYLFHYLKTDWKSRLMLADLSGLTPNDSTNTHTKRLIFGKERDPGLCYTDLETGVTYDEDNQPIDERHRYWHLFTEYWDKMNDGKPIINSFPGYLFKTGKELKAMGKQYIDDDGMLQDFRDDDLRHYNYYENEIVGYGGYVYAEPGMYENVALLDVASMHPHSILAMQCFGPYTKQFENLVDARVFIKHKSFGSLKDMFEGKLMKYLNDTKEAKSLSTALKIPINSVYGLTSASFDNAFKDQRNKNNIVALRGALFMINLKREVQSRGFVVAHIKTDSIKIPEATPEIIQFVMDYGKQYGYIFEHEETYERMCLVNDAVYIAKYKEPHKDPDTNEDIWWTATGTEFQVPYVFKKLFSKQEINFYDMTETKSVTSALYLDMNERLNDDQHDYKFVGRVGLFCPIKPGRGGGQLLRKSGEDSYAAATGTKGYRWLEADMVKNLHLEDDIDISYYERLCEEAKNHINQYGDFFNFANGYPILKHVEVPGFPADENELPF